ncbi:MAG: phage terminase large subunit [Gemmatimonadaceae bacterium]
MRTATRTALPPAALELAADLCRALDPVLLARQAGYELDPWQADALRSRYGRLLLNCSRQSGKSTVTALMAVEEAVTRPPTLILILSPSLRQSGETYRKVRAALHAMGDAAPRISRETELTLELVTGSRIVSLPGHESTIRGFSHVALLIIDEAARVRGDLIDAVRPMLAVSRGRIVMLSTPWGQRGAFFQAFTSGEKSWHRVQVTAEECPRIDPAWLADERRRIPDWVFRQEYGCEFVATDDEVFSHELVSRAVDADVIPLFPLRGAA